jgi:CRP-like cAMP-binding protein
MTEIIRQTLSHQDMEWLQNAAKPHSLKPQQVLIDRDRPLNTFYLILEGNLSANQNTLSQGDMLGLTAGPDWGGHTVQAIDNTLLLAIPKSDIQQKLQEIPALQPTYIRRRRCCWLGSSDE